MDFGQALWNLKNGNRIAREGWNGKGMYIYMVPANAYPATTPAAKEEFGDSLVPYEAYFAIRNVKGTINTWVPSISDLLADDWEVVA
jgi:hypothetical protein